MRVLRAVAVAVAKTIVVKLAQIVLVMAAKEAARAASAVAAAAASSILAKESARAQCGDIRLEYVRSGRSRSKSRSSSAWAGIVVGVVPRLEVAVGSRHQVAPNGER